MEAIVGDLFVYYEPRRAGGRSAYIAAGKVTRIDQDPSRARHYYARIADYITFDTPVPFRMDGGLMESGLRSEGETGLSGDFRNAVRTLKSEEFEAILAAGFVDEAQSSKNTPASPGFSDAPADFKRPIIEQLVRRPFREAAFSRQVKTAYANKCAFTGLEMRNGGGRSEVDAAHIKPVGDGHDGPDSVRNGLALSKTVHWMFDRGLLSIDRDNRILMANSLVPEPIKRLLLPSGEAFLPENPLERPHPSFLEYHRNKIFKDASSGI